MAPRLHDTLEYPVTDLLRVYLEQSRTAPGFVIGEQPPPVPVTDIDDLWDQLGDFA